MIVCAVKPAGMQLSFPVPGLIFPLVDDVAKILNQLRWQFSVLKLSDFGIVSWGKLNQSYFWSIFYWRLVLTPEFDVIKSDLYRNPGKLYRVAKRAYAESVRIYRDRAELTPVIFSVN